MKTLDSLTIGNTGLIKEITCTEESIKHYLQELGLHKGSRIQVVCKDKHTTILKVNTYTTVGYDSKINPHIILD